MRRGENFFRAGLSLEHNSVRNFLLPEPFLLHMALVSITEAAKLVRRNRSTLYRDIEKGRLSKTVTPDGETQIETSELLRTYGQLHADEDEETRASREKMRIALLEERNRSLERALALEAELRKVKDQVTNELRARLADKEIVIKALESKVLFLEYDKQVGAEKTELKMDQAEPMAERRAPLESKTDMRAPSQSAEEMMPRKGWWARFLHRK